MNKILLGFIFLCVYSLFGFKVEIKQNSNCDYYAHYENGEKVHISPKLMGKSLLFRKLSGNGVILEGVGKDELDKLNSIAENKVVSLMDLNRREITHFFLVFDCLGIEEDCYSLLEFNRYLLIDIYKDVQASSYLNLPQHEESANNLILRVFKPLLIHIYIKAEVASYLNLSNQEEYSNNLILRELEGLL